MQIIVIQEPDTYKTKISGRPHKISHLRKILIIHDSAPLWGLLFMIMKSRFLGSLKSESELSIVKNTRIFFFVLTGIPDFRSLLNVNLIFFLHPVSAKILWGLTHNSHLLMCENPLQYYNTGGCKRKIVFFSKSAFPPSVPYPCYCLRVCQQERMCRVDCYFLFAVWRPTTALVCPGGGGKAKYRKMQNALNMIYILYILISEASRIIVYYVHIFLLL